MKSPWKFLAELASRRRSADNQGGENGPVDNAKVVKEKARATPPALNSPEVTKPDRTKPPANIGAEGAALVPEADGTPPAVRPVDIAPTMVEVEDRSVNSAHASMPKGATAIRSLRTPRSSLASGATNNPVDTAAQSTIAANEVGGAQLSSDGDGVFQEAANLDDEIKQLRIRLAQKLHLQNDQLRKMLERFEQS